MGRFAASLARVRAEAGFPTAYAFFHKNGGRKVFPCTFAYYLRIERGKALPRPEWLGLFLTLLRIPPADALWRSFIVDYLRDHFGTEEAFQSAVAPLLRPAETAGLHQQAIRRLVSERARHLTPDQFRAVVSDDASYWCFECLVNEKGALSVAELCAVIGRPEPKIRAALKRLAAAKLVKTAGKDRWKSPLSGSFYVFPPTYSNAPQDQAKRRGYMDAAESERGASLFRAGVVLRADEASMRRCIGAFTDAMEGATAYCVYEKGEATGLYQVDTRIRRLLPF